MRVEPRWTLTNQSGEQCLSNPNDGISHRVLLLPLVSGHVVVMFDQDGREVPIDAPERFYLIS